MNLDPLFKNPKMALTSLPALSEINRLNQWIYEKAIPFSEGNILEVASGNGGISNSFVQQGVSLSLSDPKEHYCNSLRKQFGDDPRVKGIFHIDPLQEGFETANAELLGSFDTVIALNLVEHSPINKIAVYNLNELLIPGGYLIAWLPVYTALYMELDQGFNHWHKYNKESVKKMLPKSFVIIKMRYFNLIGIVGRFLSGYRLRENTDPLEQPTMFHELVPLFQIEDLAFGQKGLSTIVIAQKQ